MNENLNFQAYAMSAETLKQSTISPQAMKINLPAEVALTNWLQTE